MAEELELSYKAGGNVEWYNHSGKTVCQFLKKLNIHTTWYSSSTPTHLPKKIESVCPCQDFYVVWKALFVIASNRKPKCPSVDEWILESWCVRAMEWYYLANSQYNRGEQEKADTSPLLKRKHAMWFHLHKTLGNANSFAVTGNRPVVAWACDRRGWGEWVVATEEHEEVWGLMEIFLMLIMMVSWVCACQNLNRVLVCQL